MVMVMVMMVLLLMLLMIVMIMMHDHKNNPVSRPLDHHGIKPTQSCHKHINHGMAQGLGML